MKYVQQVYDLDCRYFRCINQYFDHKRLNAFLRYATHLGGAGLMISIVLALLVLTKGAMQFTALASAASLTLSHIPVAIVKKVYPRKRPYLVVQNSQVTDNPLVDCSFPSGHTTAIFSVIIPFILWNPLTAFLLLPVGIIVAISRVYLGLHYPTDILVGSLLGSFAGISSFLIIKHNFLFLFL